MKERGQELSIQPRALRRMDASFGAPELKLRSVAIAGSSSRVEQTGTNLGPYDYHRCCKVVSAT
jgi:hypothetical protein